ncbi:copper homeostasis protein [Gordoniibacillus kamchatkensis]|uniref:PF03932 family protein CutC n=1 Tax=Gordoniibacillus kamchatkensis TaxID=1590651 RepID=A0ABR5AMX7_9BACL|nr:copper homeostasis protein CutC [Paenibacillus sp. VKM B-2647]KIL42168.1 copper homeostasis protein [Paenibacillus sp. VKM B-2647]
MLLEVIVTNADDAIAAERGGADRLELITAVSEGGLTPSIGIVEETARAVRIPVYAMVRPHSRSFVYGESDLRAMIKDIEAIKRTPARGVVLGALTPERKVDVRTLEALLEAAEGLGVTFHRAIDEADGLLEAYETLLAYPQIERVLTSGGKASALDAAADIRRLAERSRGERLSVMAGSGLTLAALPEFLPAAGAAEIHFGKGARIRESSGEDIDVARVKAIKQCLARHGLGQTT